MSWDYALEILHDDGHTLDAVGIAPDWAPALDWTHFEGVRAGVLRALTRTDPGTIEPIWDARVGPPYVGAFRVTVGDGGGPTVSREISRRYVRRLAEAAAGDVARRHAVPAGVDLRWVVRAEPAAAVTDMTLDDFGTVVPTARPWAIAAAPLAPLLATSTSTATPTGAPVASDVVAVFVPRAVLDDARALAAGSPDVEVGGVLAGTLHRDDAGTGTFFVVVTALVPAAHGVGATATFTFTAETWAAAHGALAARGRGEVVVGWMHSHLNWCRLRGCPEARWRSCAAAQPFFSAEDAHLHATCFPAGWHLALLISDSPASRDRATAPAADDLAATLYGWSEGMVVPRAFHVLD